jgi:hypothetical protein
MNRKAYASIVTLISPALIFLALSFSTSCDSSSSTHPSGSEAIAMTSGSAQSAAINVPFASPLVVTVTTGTTPVSGAVVTFTAPSTGASGTFAGGANTATTNASGIATSAVFTSNGTTGGYAVSATVAGVATGVNFLLTNTTALVTSSNYSFYLTGLEDSNDGPNFYALAGAVSVDSSGVVVSGEQDYNDASGFTSPQPSGDIIVGGSLRADPSTGLGTLILVTNNLSLGFNGTETLGVQFVNGSHALVIQFDNSATSSGGMDLQTLPSTPGGGYAFTLSGVDPEYQPVVYGGVFSITGTALGTGMLDINDSGDVTTGTTFTGTASAPDSFGRGTISTVSTVASVVTSIPKGHLGLPTSINYYMVGPEAIRIIDVDPYDSAVGSAYGQGGGAFTDASLGTSVFGLQGNSWGFLYAAAGQLTVSAGGIFQGVADIDEQGSSLSAAAISGTYSIASNGYGSLTIPAFLEDASVLGIYATDPTLNLSDPNNKTTGLGGALIADLDEGLVGTGILIPQTDALTTSFTGNYAFGAQVFFDNEGECIVTGGNAVKSNDCGGGPWEFDFVGQGAVTAGAFVGVGLINDQAFFFDGDALDINAPVSGTAVADPLNPGRYTIPLVIAPVDGFPVTFPATIYQADGGQLLWVDVNTNDDEDLFLGSLQQQGSLTGVPAIDKPAAQSKTQKH